MSTVTYSPADVPARGDDRSRFAIPQSPSGIAVTTGQNVGLIYGQLAEAIRADLAPSSSTVTVELRKIARTVDGEYVVVPLGERSFRADYRNQRPSRFAKVDLASGPGLDSFFERRDAWTRLRDEAVFDLARDVAEQEQMSSRELVALSRAVCLAVLARAGVLAGPADLGF